jgi:hypothetical protein
LIKAFRDRPEAVSWGGGSAGGSDQILAGLFAQAVGVAPARVNYIAFSGGGESLSAILGGQVSVGVNGLAEFAPHMESGALRALAISSAERLDGVAAPTLREQGVDVVFENWRSVVAPPGITADDRRRLESVVDAMVHSEEWRDELTRYRWLDRYQPAADFARFSDAEESRVRDILRAFKTDRGQAGFAGTGPYPWLVLGGLILCGLAMVVTTEWTTITPRSQPIAPVMLIGAGAAFNLLLAERAGFVIASAVLFWCTAQAFDKQHAIRNAVLAVVISLGSYVLFSRVLQLSLPGGVLARWL